jgi:O-antigen ligase/polysaccharide polymerase Wzy-like membrane protein
VFVSHEAARGDFAPLIGSRTGLAFIALSLAAILLAAVFPMAAGPLMCVPLVLAIWRWSQKAVVLAAVIAYLVRPSLDSFTAVYIGGVNPASAFGVLTLVCGLTIALRRLWDGDPIWPDRLFGAFNWTLLGLCAVLTLVGTVHYSRTGFTTATRDFIRLFSAMLGGMLIVWWAMRKDRRVEDCVGLLVAGSVIPLCVGFYQFITDTGDKSDSNFNRLFGTFTHSQSFGAYLIPLVMVGLAGTLIKRGVMRSAAMAWTIFTAALLLLTFSRTSLLVLLAALGAFVLPSRHVTSKDVARFLLGAVAPVLLGWWLFGNTIAERFGQVAIDPASIQDALVSGSQNSFQWRIVNWAILIRLGQEHSLFGHGLGMTMVLNPLVSATSNLPYNAHDDLVRFFFEGGLFGLFGYVAHLTLMAMWLWRERMALTPETQTLGRAIVASIAALFILSLGTTEMVENTAILYEAFVLFAILITLRRRQTGPEVSERLGEPLRTEGAG